MTRVTNDQGNTSEALWNLLWYQKLYQMQDIFGYY